MLKRVSTVPIFKDIFKTFCHPLCKFYAFIHRIRWFKTQHKNQNQANKFSEAIQ